jgi:hypothetical protein
VSVYPFKKGQSGNPGGRPKEVAEVKALARAQTTIAINTLVSIAKSKKATDAARVSACVALLDRGWASPTRRITMMATFVSTSYPTGH